ncbi:1,4-alpha-glucan branching enzyme [Catalinimonas alkaloidigena]|uniref:1,4-alpha-glucan branching enzyme GlgB n=1 Tax=Catalinimonas alkaloidigena TaxID=1075417 RepID=A0A1G9NWT6_9BACT|nr:1,4-alpha-glucan branching protein GlgB [Catalinimonas alkaloidigena]SDL90821.1 1,4-alpha-glucan branching enzyme [Catalinimonas alkaloidigena]
MPDKKPDSKKVAKEVKPKLTPDKKPAATKAATQSASAQAKPTSTKAKASAPSAKAEPAPAKTEAAAAPVKKAAPKPKAPAQKAPAAESKAVEAPKATKPVAAKPAAKKAKASATPAKQGASAAAATSAKPAAKKSATKAKKAPKATSTSASVSQEEDKNAMNSSTDISLESGADTHATPAKPENVTEVPTGAPTHEVTHAPAQYDLSLLTDMDIHLFREGRHFKLYEKLGAHIMEHNGVKGTYFAVWAPNAHYVSVIGDFNNWDAGAHPMGGRQDDDSGIWEVFIPEVQHGSLYKYHIASKYNGYTVDKTDPYAFWREIPPGTASIVWDMAYDWNDQAWMQERDARAGQSQPMSVYEMHLGSWKRVPEEGFRSLSYRELAAQLPAYLKEMGFTHVEFMPIMEHPFHGSWGYQVTGYYAVSSRYGTPQDFMYLVDALHKEGIGVILDWVPSHFPTDLHGPIYFDGTHLFEHADPREGYHPDWNSAIFNYGRNEVKAFLISNALFWLDKYHADGLRVDAVASMLYRDYSRKEGEWIPNKYGGRENLEAIQFLQEFNVAVYENFPSVHTIAEESTAYAGVSHPTYNGGLGFGMKWMMGWMHDTLSYFKEDPINRSHHHNTITFSTVYGFSENFMLPLSHDEVVYGKQPLIYKMPGDDWQKFANLRNLYGYMYGHPGTKLLFMGAEFGDTSEWNHDGTLNWHLLEYDNHKGLRNWLKDVNKVYQQEKALYELPFDPSGFEWVDISDHNNSVIAFLRKSKDGAEKIMVVCNFTPVPRDNYRLGSPEAGTWTELLNSDNHDYGGSGVNNPYPIHTEAINKHGRPHSLSLTLSPLGVSYLKFQAD